MLKLYLILELLAMWSDAQKIFISTTVDCTQACNKSEVYTHCSGDLRCQESCTALPSTNCDCLKGCKCVAGYVRNPYTKECMPKTSCKDLVKPRCSNPHEEWSNFAAGCQKNCSTLNKEIKCPFIQKGCVCKKGYIRESNANSKCICTDVCRTGKRF